MADSFTAHWYVVEALEMAFWLAALVVFPAVVARKVAIAKGYSQWVGIILGSIGSYLGMFITFALNEDKAERT